MMNFSRFGAIGRAMENRNFFIYTVGSAPSTVGVWIQRLTIGWLTWKFTQSATWLGFMVFAELAPVVFLSPFAGVLADRFDRLKIAKITQSNCAAQAVLLTGLTATGLMNVWILLALVLYGGIAIALFHPVRQAMIPSLVRREDIPSAVAINVTMWQASGFIGPALAGPIIVWGGATPAFAINMVSYVFFLSALWRMRVPPQTLAEASKKGIGGDILAGYGYALSHKGIGPLLLLLLASFLLARPLVELLPGFAEGIFQRGAVGLAWMTSAAGLGSMIAGSWLAHRGTLSGVTTIAVTCVLTGTVAVFMVAASQNFAVAVAGLSIIGFSLTAAATGIQTLIQAAADRPMLGRVLSLYYLFSQGAAAIGALIMGVLGSAFGLRIPVAVGAVLCLFAWTWAARRRRAIALLTEPG